MVKPIAVYLQCHSEIKREKHVRQATTWVDLKGITLCGKFNP